MDNFLNNLRNSANYVGGQIYSAADKLNPVRYVYPFNQVMGTPAKSNNQVDPQKVVEAMKTLGYQFKEDNVAPATSDVNENVTAETISVEENTPNLGDTQTDTAKDKIEQDPTPSTSGTIQYKYKKGDTFGQVLLDLGLSKPGQLWGSDGDVAYYTEQLRKQGITGNVPVGTVITLTPRESLKNEILENWAKNATK